MTQPMTLERGFELVGNGLELIIMAVAIVVAAPFMVLGWILAQLGLVE